MNSCIVCLPDGGGGGGIGPSASDAGIWSRVSVVVLRRQKQPCLRQAILNRCVAQRFPRFVATCESCSSRCLQRSGRNPSRHIRSRKRVAVCVASSPRCTCPNANPAVTLRQRNHLIMASVTVDAQGARRKGMVYKDKNYTVRAHLSTNLQAMQTHVAERQLRTKPSLWPEQSNTCGLDYLLSGSMSCKVRHRGSEPFGVAGCCRTSPSQTERYGRQTAVSSSVYCRVCTLDLHIPLPNKRCEFTSPNGTREMRKVCRKTPRSMLKTHA